MLLLEAFKILNLLNLIPPNLGFLKPLPNPLIPKPQFRHTLPP